MSELITRHAVDLPAPARLGDQDKQGNADAARRQKALIISPWDRIEEGS